MNCWIFRKCAPRVRLLCPAHPDNGMRCWKVTGTMCDGGKVKMASLAEKIDYCRNCDFYRNFAEHY